MLGVFQSGGISVDWVNKVKFDSKGLVAAVIQDYKSNNVLMLAYMNKESLLKTYDTGFTWFYSRSRRELWNKGESSGNTQRVMEMSYDCDGDTLLIKVEQIGVPCHTGADTCFFNPISKAEDNKKSNVICELYSLLLQRKNKPLDGSYTNYLFNEGKDKILKKIGEEASEVIIGAKNQSKDEVIYEVSDLIYHLLVLLVDMEITIQDIADELVKRKK